MCCSTRCGGVEVDGGGPVQFARVHSAGTMGSVTDSRDAACSCPQCGTPGNVHDVFCSDCGELLPGAKAPYGSATTPTPPPATPLRSHGPPAQYGSPVPPSGQRAPFAPPSGSPVMGPGVYPNVVVPEPRSRRGLWVALIVLLVVFAGGVADLVMRNSSAANLAKAIETAEEVLLEYQRTTRTAESAYDFDDEGDVGRYVADVLRPEAADALAAYNTAVERVASVPVLQWHQHIEIVRGSYLEHAGAWAESLQLAADGDLENIFSERVGNAISTTWAEFCGLSATATPYLDVNGVERSFVYINERGGCAALEEDQPFQ